MRSVICKWRRFSFFPIYMSFISFSCLIAQLATGVKWIKVVRSALIWTRRRAWRLLPVSAFVASRMASAGPASLSRHRVLLGALVPFPVVRAEGEARSAPGPPCSGLAVFCLRSPLLSLVTVLQPRGLICQLPTCPLPCLSTACTFLFTTPFPGFHVAYSLISFGSVVPILFGLRTTLSS